MADILKVTTPMVEKTPINPSRPVADPSIPFDLSNVTRVIGTHDSTEILQHNTGYIPQEEAPKILTDLLKDPSVTVSLIKNIYMLEEVIKLLPANNDPLSQEVEQLFNQLLINPDEIPAELKRQEQSTTLFKGEFFDILRSLLVQPETAERPEIATGIGVLLKALNTSISKTDTLNSVANNLQFLADSLGEGNQLADRILKIIPQLRSPDASAQFPQLKEQVLQVIQDVEHSILFSPQMEKVLPLIVYNLSRFNDNPDFLPEALNYLLSQIDSEPQKETLIQKLDIFLKQFFSPDGAKIARQSESESQVMEVLAKIIGRQADSDELKLMSGDKLEKIVHSLLSSPSNFTPLLHFIVPLEFMDIKSFAEIWIDPNAEEESERGGGTGNANHMLMVFDVEGIGRFETELYVKDRRIAMNLLCPSAYYDAFKGIGNDIRRALDPLGYRFEAINIDKLERTHSLMDVFTDLPKKRMGIDVKI